MSNSLLRRWAGTPMNRQNLFCAAMTLVLVSALLSETARAVDDALLCRAAKLKITANYERCRIFEVVRAARRATLFIPDFSNCDERLSKAWAKPEKNYGSGCPTFGDQPTIQQEAISCTATISRKLAGRSRVFLSSVTYQGNLGGLTGADAKCQALADAQLLGGRWAAWLSDGSTDARDRLSSDGPFQLLDGRLVANSLADLTDGSISHEINRSELSDGSTQSCTNLVWTGTYPDGTRDTSILYPNCSNWSASSGAGGGYGNSTVGDAYWTSISEIACDVSCGGHLYCFEQP